MVWGVLIFGGCAAEERPKSGKTPWPRSPKLGMSEARQVAGFEGLMAHAQRAREAEARQDWSTARDEYQKALAQEPRHPIVLLRVARYEAKLGQAEAAIQHLNGVGRTRCHGRPDPGCLLRRSEGA